MCKLCLLIGQLWLVKWLPFGRGRTPFGPKWFHFNGWLQRRNLAFRLVQNKTRTRVFFGCVTRVSLCRRSPPPRSFQVKVHRTVVFFLTNKLCAHLNLIAVILAPYRKVSAIWPIFNRLPRLGRMCVRARVCVIIVIRVCWKVKGKDCWTRAI